MNWHEEFDKLTEKEKQEFGAYTSKSLRKTLSRITGQKQERTVENDTKRICRTG